MSQLSKDNSGRELKASKLRELYDYVDFKIKKYYPEQKDTIELRQKIVEETLAEGLSFKK